MEHEASAKSHGYRMRENSSEELPELNDKGL